MSRKTWNALKCICLYQAFKISNFDANQTCALNLWMPASFQHGPSFSPPPPNDLTLVFATFKAQRDWRESGQNASVMDGNSPGQSLRHQSLMCFSVAPVLGAAGVTSSHIALHSSWPWGDEQKLLTLVRVQLQRPSIPINQGAESVMSLKAADECVAGSSHNLAIYCDVVLARGQHPCSLSTQAASLLLWFLMRLMRNGRLTKGKVFCEQLAVAESPTTPVWYCHCGVFPLRLLPGHSRVQQFILPQGVIFERWQANGSWMHPIKRPLRVTSQPFYYCVDIVWQEVNRLSGSKCWPQVDLCPHGPHVFPNFLLL